MALCENVYRRGGVYWWRRRLRLGNRATSTYLHCSLRVYDQSRARVLARLVSVEADRVRSLGMLTASEQRGLLKRFIDQQVGHLDAATCLVAHHSATTGTNADLPEVRARRDRRMAAVYAALGARGVAAEIGEVEATKLAAFGFDADDIDEIGERVRFLRECLPRLAADGTISAQGTNGLLGPSNIALRAILGELDADATNPNVELARRLWLQALAVALGDSDHRHAPLTPGFAEEVYRNSVGRSQSPAGKADTAGNRSKARDYTISGQIESMVTMKKGVDWKITKRGDQAVSDIAETYVFLGKILVKMIGSDDLREFRAEHPMDLRKTLQSLPTLFGKSPSDWNMTFEEARSKASAAGKRIGREGTTLLKYLNCFQSFVSFLKGCDFAVSISDENFKNAKPKATKRKSNTLRSSISDGEYKVLFADETWCGPNVVHDSTYWVPLFTRYGGGRLEEPCGLMIDEIDFDSPIPSYLIQENTLRTIKSEARRIPFHAELLRLDVRDYYEAVKALGFKELFPDLPARGRRTSIGSLLNKKFVPILDRALPNARASKKTQHSSRKSLNTELRDNKIDITIRCEILGHAQQGVNAQVYTDPARDEDKKAAIETIANVTEHLPARPIRLSLLLRKAV